MARMKTGTGRFLKTIIFICIFLLCFFFAVRLVERKDSKRKNASFFEVADEIDVLFLGSSHMINGVNPVQLYEDYGVASYNLGGHGNVLPVTYWTLVNALDYCDPSYVIVDTFMLEKDYHYVDQMMPVNSDSERENSVGQLHGVLDAFPLSEHKYQAVRDLISDPELRKEFLFNFIRYHSRWSSLETGDYTEMLHVNSSSYMGAEMRLNTDQRMDRYALIRPDEQMEQETVGKLYLRRILDLCRQRNIQVILVQIPYSAHPDYQRAANSAQIIADEYQIPYLNLMYTEDLIDIYSDLSSQTHLNARGAYKVTAYLGKILRDDLKVPDRRDDAGCKPWEDLEEDWHDLCRYGAVNSDDLYSALTMLQFDEVSSVIYINNHSQAFHDTAVIHLVIQLAGGSLGMESAASFESPYCAVHDSKEEKYVETMGDIPLEDYQTSFGTVNYRNFGGLYSMLTVGDDKETNLLNYDEYDEIDVQLFVFDNDTGEMIGHMLYENAGMQKK